MIIVNGTIYNFNCHLRDLQIELKIMLRCICYYKIPIIRLLLPILFYLPFTCCAVKADDTDALMFSAPPRETPEKGKKVYAPIAKFISKTLGREVVYRHPLNWANYSSNLRKDTYDLIFDGPHFVSWRIANRKHRPIIKIPGDFFFYFISRKDNLEIVTLKDVVGKSVCGQAPPNQGTLRLLDKFENPMRQPYIKEVRGWRNIFKAVISKKCEVGIVPSKIYNEMDEGRRKTKIIFETTHVAGQAITGGNKINLKEINEIRTALLSSDGYKATKALRQRFSSPILTAATVEEYNDIYKLLRHTYWFR